MLTSCCSLVVVLHSLTVGQTPSIEAQQLWQQGQDALLDDREAKAVECFEESLALDPHLTKNYLSLAAVYLGRGEDQSACRYLTLYLAAHPEHIQVRGHYADLLHRLNRLIEAQHHYEQFVTDLQEDEKLAKEHLMQTHSRLMQIAEKLSQGYEEHLHRGIGLYLLAKNYASRASWKGEESQEGLLCRAAGELTLAREVRPEEARPCWYLYEVWSTLLQSQPARRHLRLARENAFQTRLTPMEHQALRLACQQSEGLSRFAK